MPESLWKLDQIHSSSEYCFLNSQIMLPALITCNKLKALGRIWNHWFQIRCSQTSVHMCNFFFLLRLPVSLYAPSRIHWIPFLSYLSLPALCLMQIWSTLLPTHLFSLFSLLLQAVNKNIEQNWHKEPYAYSPETLLHIISQVIHQYRQNLSLEKDPQTNKVQKTKVKKMLLVNPLEC